MSAKTYEYTYTKGLQSELESLNVGDGVLRFTVDTNRLYFDQNNSRTLISNVITGFTDTEIHNLLVYLPKAYLASDTNKLYTSDGVNLLEITPELDSPTEISDDNNYTLWMTDNNGSAPKYNSNAYYNPKSTYLRVGDFGVEKTQNYNYNLDQYGENYFNLGDEDEGGGSIVPDTGALEFGDLDEQTQVGTQDDFDFADIDDNNLHFYQAS